VQVHSTDTVYAVALKLQIFIQSNKMTFNSFTANVALMHLKKIVQPQLISRLAKAVFELGLHYFLFHLAKTHKLTNIVDLLISLFHKLSIILKKKV